MQKSLLALGLTFLASPVLAHHPLGGLPMESFSDGLLSGIGHPLLGFDHLFFVLLVGIAAVIARQRLAAPAAYLSAMLLGCLLSSTSLFPANELMVALSLLILGGMLLSGRGYRPAVIIGSFSAFGLFHGAAFGATLATQESGFGIALLAGYLIGLVLVQYLLALAGGWLCASLWRVQTAEAIQPRLAGAMVAGVGLFLVLETLEAPLLSALGV